MTASATRSRRRQTGRPGSVPLTEAAAARLGADEIRRHTDTIDLLARRLEAAEGAQLSEAGIADLERRITSDPGWRAFVVLSDQEFTVDGMRQMRAVCRLMSISNPMIKRGLSVRAHYVWGQGCEITARADGKNRDNDAEQDVRGVVSRFIRDEANQRAMFGQQAREENERALGTDGEVFVALFTRPRSGWVQARTFPADEITEVICDPEDRSTPWFYRRVWNRNGYDANGVAVPEQREQLYPDVDYKPRRRPSSFAGVPIAWDAPVVHVHVNRPKGWLRGIPDAYSVVNWARAYKEFLEQWSKLMAALSKFAWRLTAEGKHREQAKQAIRAAGASRSAGLGDMNDVGGTAITPPGATMEAIPKSGATIDSESGRPLAAMVAAGLDLPITMLLGDPGTTGARATAETLDWPTELAMMARREVWTAAQLRIVRHVITEAVRAGAGPLKGTINRDDVTEREVVTLTGKTDDTVDIVWPDLDEVDPAAVITAIVQANSTGTLKPDLVLRLVLAAMSVRDADSILAEMVDEDGKFLWPETPGNAAMGPGQQAADLARNGGDPANQGTGSMAPDEDGMGATTPAGGQPGGTPGQPAEPGVTAEAMARQADFDAGLFGADPPTGDTADQDEQDQDEPADDTGGTTEAPTDGAEDEQPDETGEQPAGQLYNPAFFRI